MYKGAMRGQNKKVSKGIALGPPEKKQKHDPTQNFARIKERKERDRMNREEAMKHYEERVPNREE